MLQLSRQCKSDIQINKFLTLHIIKFRLGSSVFNHMMKSKKNPKIHSLYTCNIWILIIIPRHDTCMLEHFDFCCRIWRRSVSWSRRMALTLMRWQSPYQMTRRTFPNTSSPSSPPCISSPTTLTPTSDAPSESHFCRSKVMATSW